MGWTGQEWWPETCHPMWEAHRLEFCPLHTLDCFIDQRAAKPLASESNEWSREEQPHDQHDKQGYSRELFAEHGIHGRGHRR